MGKYLPIVIPVFCALLILVFGYFYIQSSKNSATSLSDFNTPTEVPSALPDKNRIENLESSVSLLVGELSGLKSSIATASTETQTSTSLDFRLKTLEAFALDLKARVSALEKPIPTSTPTTSKPPLFIPLGTGGQSGDQTWISISTYQVSLDPSEYSGYTGIVLEVNMKLNQASGTGYARLYNLTDSRAVSSEVSTTSDTYGWFSSSSFTLSSGKKTYQLQLKSSTGTEIAIQNARLKISF